MCSTTPPRITDIGQAIDDLAADALAAYARPESDASVPAAQAAGTAPSEADQVVIRLAQLWARLAELDPEVARRLPTYEA